MILRSLLAILLLAYLLLTLLSHGGVRYLRPRLVLLLGLVTVTLVDVTEHLVVS